MGYNEESFIILLITKDKALAEIMNKNIIIDGGITLWLLYNIKYVLFQNLIMDV